MKSFATAQSLIFGTNYDNEKCWMPSIRLKAENAETLIANAAEKLADFNKNEDLSDVDGICLLITEQKEIIIGGELYTSSKQYTHFFGLIPEEGKRFITELFGF